MGSPERKWVREEWGFLTTKEKKERWKQKGEVGCAGEKKNSRTAAKTERRKDATAAYKSWKTTVLVPYIKWVNMG